MRGIRAEDEDSSTAEFRYSTSVTEDRLQMSSPSMPQIADRLPVTTLACGSLRGDILMADASSPAQSLTQAGDVGEWLAISGERSLPVPRKG